MLRLKGQTESGEIINFNISDILGAKSDYIALNGRHGHILLLTESVQPANDPRRAMLEEIKCEIRCRQNKTKCEFEEGWEAALNVLIVIFDEMEAKL